MCVVWTEREGKDDQLREGCVLAVVVMGRVRGRASMCIMCIMDKNSHHEKKDVCVKQRESCVLEIGTRDGTCTPPLPTLLLSPEIAPKMATRRTFHDTPLPPTPFYDCIF